MNMPKVIRINISLSPLPPLEKQRQGNSITEIPSILIKIRLPV